MRKRIVYIISAVLVITVFFVMISGCEASEEEYKHAIELLNEGKTDEAYEILTGLHGYADSMEIAENIFNDKYLDALSYARAGDIITFGNYEQDNKYADGEEPIEWQVLERAGDRILVISRYALDCIQYHSSNKDVTWEKSSIRRWLNRSFRSSAFDEIESSRIEETYLTSVSQMSDDPDYIFLLDEPETKKYFKETFPRQCPATRYAESNGVYTDDKPPYPCNWWLRSSGTDGGSYAMCVLYNGKINTNGNLVTDDYRAVRPAMWINTGKVE